jgi:Co/Zn/Cd efflux system component
MSEREDTASSENGRLSPKPTNEYVLNVAFFSFVGFMCVQAIFALIANSKAMLADSEAMSVDAFTYLFNLWAERIKKKPHYSEHEFGVSLELLNHQQELRRLYLELIPPAISVATLIMVTVFTLRDAIQTVYGEESGQEDEDVDIPIMLFFSGLNLLLDVVNVTCFARAESAFGLDSVWRRSTAFSASIRQKLRPSSSNLKQRSLQESYANESSSLLPLEGGKLELEREGETSTLTKTTSFASIISEQPRDVVNLNMCSAWTVSQTVDRSIKKRTMELAHLARLWSDKNESSSNLD